MLGFETLTLAPIDRRLIDPGCWTPTSAPGSTPTTPGCSQADPAGRPRNRGLARRRLRPALIRRARRGDSVVQRLNE